MRGKKNCSHTSEKNEKIQKKLNVELYEKTAELVENEKELRDINETKDKLFSIIAHYCKIYKQVIVPKIVIVESSQF